MKKENLLFYNEYEQFYEMAEKSIAFQKFCCDSFGQDERDRAEGLWRSLPVLSGFLQLQFGIHFFYFCRQAFPLIRETQTC